MSISYKFENDIAEITFDDGKVNAMDIPWWQKATELLDQAKADKPKALIIRGREGVFSAGLNLKQFANADAAGLDEIMEVYNVFINRIRCFPAPTVAEVTGATIAGGCMIICACDYIVALKGDYHIQLNEHVNGIPLPAWCYDICAAKFPQPHLDNLTLLAIPYTPSKAYQIGAIQGLASSPEELSKLAYETAIRFSKLNVDAFAHTKQRVNKAINIPAEDRLSP